MLVCSPTFLPLRRPLCPGPIYLSVCLSDCLSLSVYIFSTSKCLSICLPLHLSSYLFMYLDVTVAKKKPAHHTFLCLISLTLLTLLSHLYFLTFCTLACLYVYLSIYPSVHISLYIWFITFICVKYVKWRQTKMLQSSTTKHRTARQMLGTFARYLAPGASSWVTSKTERCFRHKPNILGC